MQNYLQLTLLVAFATPIFLPVKAEAIIRRHDLEDSAYVVEASQYPAMVDLLEPGDCIATLISPTWLITAAHCAEHFVLPGTLTIAGNRFDVEAVKLPTTWQDDLDDIALIQLTEAVTEVAPIGLYTQSDEVGQTVWFVGRGDTNTGLQGQSGAGVDGKTRRASNTIVAADAWWIEFVFNSPDDSEVTELEGISGDGDSGGPALIETSEGLKIAGLSSYQDEGNHSLGTYGVREYYTRISQYQTWIAEHMGPADNAEANSSDSEEGADAAAHPQSHGSADDENQTESAPESGGCSSLPGQGNTHALLWLLMLGLMGYRRQVLQS